MATLRESRKQIYVKCPFYKGDLGKRHLIGCEGLLSSSHVEHVFQSRDGYITHFRQYCAGRWEQCPYADSLNEKKYAE